MAAVRGRAKKAPHQASFRERVALCTSSYDLSRLTRQVATEHNYHYFSFIRLPSAKDDKLAPLMVLDNWPEALVKAYDERGLLKSSPVFTLLKTTTWPHVFSHNAGSSSYVDGDPAIMDLFRDHGIHGGVYLTVQEPGGKRGTVCFAGDRSPPPEAELAELGYFANLAYSRLWELRRSARTKKTQKLSSRENECLVWTASGKTSAEIAIILKLSEHTVNHYLTSACQKLAATNRAHAVYKAMRAGYLD